MRPLKKLSLIPKYSIDITGNDNTMHEPSLSEHTHTHTLSHSLFFSQNFHHRIYLFPQSFFRLWHIKRCGIIRISCWACGVLVHVKMCATHNRPLCRLSMKFMVNGLAVLSSVFFAFQEKNPMSTKRPRRESVSLRPVSAQDKNYGEDTSFPSSASFIHLLAFILFSLLQMVSLSKSVCMHFAHIIY